VAEKHGGKTVASNLGFCCALCNRRKGSDLSSLDPKTEEVVNLFHPRKDRWSDHFRLEGVRILPLTPAGRATAHLLGFNTEARWTERRARQPATREE
jgi:hypothetical protein